MTEPYYRPGPAGAEQYRQRRARRLEEMAPQTVPLGDPWEPQPQQPQQPTGSAAKLMLVPLAVGSAVAITLGVYGNTHTGTNVAVSVAGFSGPLEAKVWLTTGAFFFVLVQVFSALVMYGKLPIAAPDWIGAAHRWSGRIAFLLTVPVAVHCLYAVGFLDFNTRVFAHSLLGCVFFGAFTVKMLGLRKDALPNWVLPAVGGVLFAIFVGLWWTSALWYFTTFGIKY